MCNEVGFFGGFRTAKSQQCRDCGSFNGSYMLKQDLWEKAVPEELEWHKSYDGSQMSKCYVICINCITKRLGRDLCRDDFIDAPVNDVIFYLFDHLIKPKEDNRSPIEFIKNASDEELDEAIEKSETEFFGENKDKKIERLLERAKKAEEEVKKLSEALYFYADPDSYFGIAFFPDPPCGSFMDDFSGDHEGDFDRNMPGDLARKTLKEIRMVSIIEVDGCDYRVSAKLNDENLANCWDITNDNGFYVSLSCSECLIFEDILEKSYCYFEDVVYSENRIIK